MSNICCSTDAGRSVEDQRQICVRFATVSVRQFSYTLGDSPSTSCGPPTALSWSYSCPNSLNTISIERYEALCHPQDQPRRSRRELKMSVERRRQILQDICDDDDDDDDDNDDNDNDNEIRSSNNGHGHGTKVTPDLIAKAERRVERNRRRLEKNRAYANMTTYFPRRINTKGRSASFPPTSNNHKRYDVLKDDSLGEPINDIGIQKNETWDPLLSTLDTTPAYLKAAEMKAELLREEFLLPVMKATASSSATANSYQPRGDRAPEQYVDIVRRSRQVSKQRSFNSRAA